VKYLVIIFLFSLSIDAKTVWHTSVIKGFELAKKKNAPVVIDLYSEWCGYCKTLENEIFPAAIVDSILTKYVAIRINGEEYPNLMQRYGVRGYPTILILDKNGYYLSKITGLPTKEMVSQKLLFYYEKRNLEEEMLQAGLSQPKNPETSYNLGVYYYQTGDLDKSTGYFKKAAFFSDNSQPSKVHDSFFNLALVYMDMEKFDLSVNQWSLYFKKYKQMEADYFSAYYFRGISYSKLGQNGLAIQDWKKASAMAIDPNKKKHIDELISKSSTME